jgi:hypothetical protein
VTAAAASGQAGGGVQQPVAQGLGLGAGQRLVEGQQPRPASRYIWPSRPAPPFARGPERHGKTDKTDCRHRGLIHRIEHTHTYVPTPDSQRMAIFYTKLYSLLRPAGGRQPAASPTRTTTALTVIDRHVDYPARRRRPESMPEGWRPFAGSRRPCARIRTGSSVKLIVPGRAKPFALGLQATAASVLTLSNTLKRHIGWTLDSRSTMSLRHQGIWNSILIHDITRTGNRCPQP